MTDTAETMVERVAQAVEAARRADPYKWHPDQNPKVMYEFIARTAIAAMAEPTAEMLRAAQAAEHEHFWPGKSPTSHTWQSLPTMLVKKIWTAMARIALTEKPE